MTADQVANRGRAVVGHDKFRSRCHRRRHRDRIGFTSWLPLGPALSHAAKERGDA